MGVLIDSKIIFTIILQDFDLWMIHNRKLNKKINKVHERELRIVYGDHKASFSEFFNIDRRLTIHQRNLQ